MNSQERIDTNGKVKPEDTFPRQELLSLSCLNFFFFFFFFFFGIVVKFTGDTFSTCLSSNIELIEEAWHTTNTEDIDLVFLGKW